MSVRKRGGINRFATAALALLAVAGVIFQPGVAQTRTLASLADVPAVKPAPYHPHATAAVYRSLLYDGYQGTGAHYWH